MTTPDVGKRAATYCEDRGYAIDSRLGVGTQGTVYVANIPSPFHDRSEQVAVGFHDREIAYNREIGGFLRLQDLQVDEVCGHMVPLLIGCDDDLLAIEMTIVSPPFCLDFGGAYLDQPPDYFPPKFGMTGTNKNPKPLATIGQPRSKSFEASNRTVSTSPT